MKTKVIVSVLILLSVFGAWYLSQSNSHVSHTTSSGDQGIKFN